MSTRTRTRLERLERPFRGDGCCPECGFRPNSIRVITFGCVGEPKPKPEWSTEDICTTCGGLRPPIRFVDFDGTVT
jgi:hypothetical protein